ncbi:TonB-dependent receptor [Novosphingobium sp. CECT 9465]|uniref:TonB-dependent receptor n=1 Tax=Novosphingobium sp. CECT 9465 TaxID=2829794 RepID=UPI001E2969E3|nr:TonB-dependent receptor [Novosphingobium sp. CECT 9465]CAH0495291.1 Vitamin B12 transporter BtuB [Novosphingobium sp. CECT 9465]
MQPYRFLLSSLSLATMAWAGTAQAQDAAINPPSAGQSAAEGSADSGIVVTARRREERLQEVPVSIAVLTADQIERQGVRSVADIARLTPGLQVSQGFGPDDVRPTLRGISTLRGRPSVALLEDGIDSNSAAIGTAGGGSLMNMQLLDLERVEVVRGPQSTLYGRNAFAGAINYVTKRPTHTFEGGVQAQSMTYDAQDIGGYINAPLSDTLAVRINAGYHQFGGFYRNATNGAAVGEEESFGVRAQVLFEPTANLSFLLRYGYTSSRNGQAAASLQTFNATTPGGFKYVSGPVTGEPDNITFFGDLPGLESDIHRGSLDVELDLGGVSLHATTYGLAYDASQGIDAAWGQEPALPFGFSVRQLFLADMKTRQISQELRLQNEGQSRLKWLVGAYFLHENAELTDKTEAFFASCANRLASVRPLIGCSNGLNNVVRAPSDPAIFPYSFEKRKTMHISGYASLGYEVLDGLTFTGEARLARETIDVAHAPVARSFALLGFASFTGGPFKAANFLPTGGYVLPPTETASASITYFNPRVAVNYKVSPDLMIYGSYAKGTKPGGFAQITNTERYDLSRYGPEKLYSWELGVKGSAFDRKLIFDLAGFYSIYRDQQINFNQIVNIGGINVAQTAVGNAGRARSYGLEMQLALHPIDPLYLNISYAHTISQYTDFVLDADSAAVALFPGGDVSGNYLPDVPKDAVTVDARFVQPVSGDDKVVFQITESYLGRRFINSDSTNQAYLPSYFQTDASIGIESDRWSLALFARNLFDDDTPRAAFRYLNLASATASDQAAVVMLAPRRQLGVRAGIRF